VRQQDKKKPFREDVASGPHRRARARKRRRQRDWRRGRWAERATALYLRGMGYQILARNLRLGRGEIDLIARHGQFLVFMEVKFRRHSYGPMISPHQWRRIADVAQNYVGKRPDLHHLWWRFDAFEWTPWPRHRKDAWRIYDCAGGRNE
jgi:putative endonuclease